MNSEEWGQAALERALATQLMGAPGSWVGWAGHPLRTVPPQILGAALKWFRERSTETQGEESARRLSVHIAAIVLVLAHLEKNSPQGKLEL